MNTFKQNAAGQWGAVDESGKWWECDVPHQTPVPSGIKASTENHSLTEELRFWSDGFWSPTRIINATHFLIRSPLPIPKSQAELDEEAFQEFIGAHAYATVNYLNRQLWLAALAYRDGKDSK